MSLKHTLRLPVIDYKDEIKGDPLRYKTLEGVKNIIRGDVATAFYYVGYAMNYRSLGYVKYASANFKEARGSLEDASARIDIFEEDGGDSIAMLRRSISSAKKRIDEMEWRSIKLALSKRRLAA